MNEELLSLRHPSELSAGFFFSPADCADDRRFFLITNQLFYFCSLKIKHSKMLQYEMESQGNILFRWRSYLPIIILIGGLAVYMNTQFNIKEGIANAMPFSFDLLCLGISTLGLLIRIYTVGHTPKNTSGRNTAEGQVADEVNTTGIYSLVRHPLYVGNFFMWLGPAMYTADIWFTVSFIMLYYVYYERIMYAEEQFLVGKFGEIYASWAKITPAFIPSFKNWNTARLGFSWKKVLKKEKNGLFAMFAVFFIFHAVGKYIQGGSPSEEEFWMTGTMKFWTYGTAITGVIYFILKFFKKYTKVFEEEGR